jgi:hypothetical protein
VSSQLLPPLWCSCTKTALWHVGVGGEAAAVQTEFVRPTCRDYYFTTKQQLLRDIRGKKFLEAARVTMHSHPCTSSAAAAALAPPQPLSYWYGTSLATVREVAATGKLCIMSLDVQGAEVCFPIISGGLSVSVTVSDQSPSCRGTGTLTLLALVCTLVLLLDAGALLQPAHRRPLPLHQHQHC